MLPAHHTAWFVSVSVSFCVNVCVCLFFWAGGNKISQAVNAAHDGSIFSICVVKDGGLLTGGKDRRLIEWDITYKKTGREHEVGTCDV